jgi:hypothetical protein
MGVGVHGHAPAALPPGKTRYSLDRNLGGPQGCPGWVQKILPPPGFDPQTVQPLANCYTNYAVPAHPTLFRMAYNIYGKIQTEHGMG